MGIIASRHLSVEKLQQIQNESGFSPLRIDYLMGEYQTLGRDADGRVLRSELLKVPPIAQHPLGDRLVDVYLYPSHGFRHFLHGLSCFRRDSPSPHKLLAVLAMFDADGDGLLTELECDELLVRLPATSRELRSMRWKLRRLLADHQTDGQTDQPQVGFINCDDLAYITRDVDLDQKLSLRFN